MVDNIYFDTCFLLFHQQEDDQGRHAKREIGRAENMSKRHPIILKTSIVALGEAMMECCAQHFDPVKVVDLIRRLKADTPSPDLKVLELTQELSEKDYVLRPCDAMIVAQALRDRDAIWLLTTDPDIIGSKAIKDKIKELGSRLNISDRIEKRRRRS